MPSKKHLISKYLFLLTITVAILAPLGFLYAADPPPAPAYVPLAPLTGLTPPDEIAGEGLTGYLQTLFWLAIVSAGVLAVLMITLGGIQYMTSEAFTSKGEARTRITMAIVGFLLAISAVLILTTINPDLLTFKILTRPLKFAIPESTSLTQGAIPGCTNFVDPPVTGCVWFDVTVTNPTNASARCEEAIDATKNWVSAVTESSCAGERPGPYDKCCLYVTPGNGCTGRGRYEGYTQCQWSVQANFVPDDCTVEKGVPAGLSATEEFREYVCSGNDRRYGVDCCAKK